MITMQLIINGQQRQLPDGANLEAALGALGVNPLQVAIELNGSIVPKSTYGSVALKAGDAMEVVQFIGGG